MTEKHSPLPWAHRTGLENEIITDADEDIVCRMPNHPENGKLWHLDAPLIVRSVNGLPEAIAALEDLHQKAGVVATWLNHWDVPFASEDEWRGPTGDGQLFFDALNRAAAALTKLKG